MSPMPEARTRAGLLALSFLAAAAVALPGCYSRRFRAVEHNVDSLFARTDSLAREHAKTRAELEDVHRELDRQSQTVRSLRAGSETSAQELVVRVDQLEAKLEDQTQRLNSILGRAQTRSLADSGAAGAAGAGAPGGGAPGRGAVGAGVPGGGAPGGVRVDPTAAYDQAVLDFTQGRFGLALGEFRDFVATYPTSDLADNSQYGVGESFYAQGKYDSAAVEYRRVPDAWPQGDKVPAALYKLGIAYQKMSRSADARAAFKLLKEKYPRSGEARLADERLKEMGAR